MGRIMKIKLSLKDTHLDIIDDLKKKYSVSSNEEIVTRFVKSALQLQNDDFIFNIVSCSKKNVIRGFHIQTKFKQAKYVSVLKGAILDVALDLRKGSKTFGKHFKIILSADNNKSVFLPAGFAHGFLALKKENIVNYNITNYRSPKHEVSLVWNDKDLKIKWPSKKVIVSKKDKGNLTFKKYILYRFLNMIKN